LPESEDNILKALAMLEQAQRKLNNEFPEAMKFYAAGI